MADSQPSQPKVLEADVWAPVWSILSLLALGVVSLMVVVTLGTVFHIEVVDRLLLWHVESAGEYPAWSLISFALAAFGSFLGVAWEMPAIGINATPAAETIKVLRAALVPGVVGSTLYSVLTLTQPHLAVKLFGLIGLDLDAGTARDGLLAIIATFVVLFQFFVFALGSANAAVLLVIFAEYAIMFFAVYLSPNYATLPTTYLYLFIAFNAGAFLDPKIDVVFHVVSAVGAVFYALSLTSLGEKYVWQQSIAPHALAIVISVYLLVPFTMRHVAPVLYSKWRQPWANLVWNMIYVQLITMKAQFPVQMTEAEFSNQKKIKVNEYYINHKRATGFSVPSVPGDEIPATNFLNGLINTIVGAFTIIRQLDHFIPQARVSVHVTQKARTVLGKVGENKFRDYYPPSVRDKLGDIPAPGEVARSYYFAGQWLAYLAQFGHAATMLQRSDDARKGTVMLDYNFMNTYEVKPGQQKYGGKAYFRWIKSTKSTQPPQLLLLSLETPDGKSFTPPALPANWTPSNARTDEAFSDEFKKAQAIVATSSNAHVVIIKHCAGHHTYFNLIAVSLNNAFDSEPWIKSEGVVHPHPLRAALLPHFYNHIVVEEKTTAHLLEDLAVFPQIFAFSHSALAKYFNHEFSRLSFLQDADLASRLDVLGYQVTDAQLTEVSNDISREFVPVGREEEKAGLPQQIDPTLRSQISWEVSYHRLLTKYATALVNAVYKSDKEVADDPFIKRLNVEIRSALKQTNLGQSGPVSPTDAYQTLPVRFGTLSTRSTLARLITDIIFCVSIRHEIYGKISTQYGLDYTMIQTQVADDFGPPAVEDFLSLVYVALATSKPQYIPFLYDYTPLLDPIANTRFYEPVRSALHDLQTWFYEIERVLKHDSSSKAINVQYHRPVPSDLCPGSCY